MADKDTRKKEEEKSLLNKIMTFGARDKAAKAPPEKYVDPEKKKKFRLKK